MEDRLHKFARLVSMGSFTRAAAALHVSQPALSTAIRKLERELGTELIIRSHHAFTLTKAGEVAYAAARDLSVQAQNLQAALSELSHEKLPLRLGMIDSVATMLFVHKNTLGKLEESASISLNIDSSARLVRFVDHNDLDLAFITHTKELPPTLTQQELGHEPLILVAHRDHAQQARTELDAHRLERFLSYNYHSQTHQLIDSHFADQNINLQPIFYSTHPEVTLQLVLANRGVAVLPYLLVKQHIKQKSIVPLATQGGSVIHRHISVVCRNKRILPQEVHQLIDETSTQLVALQNQSTGIRFF